LLSFLLSRFAGRYDSNIPLIFRYLPKGMNDEQRNPIRILPQGYPTLFGIPVFFIEDGDGQWIKKNLSGTLKAYPKLSSVVPGLVWVPIKIVLQGNLPP
jgi:hypothetical protein